MKKDQKLIKAEQILIDNGIERDEAEAVLQAIGYALLDIELYDNQFNGSILEKIRARYSLS